MTNNIVNNEALDNIRMAMAKLMSRQFFYFNIAKQFRLQEVADPAHCPTMGVGYHDNVMWLVYNPTFVKYYTFQELSVIIEHEISHFTYDHVKHFKGPTVKKVFSDEKEAADYIREKEEAKIIHKMQNIATDRSINVYLPELPKIRMTLATFNGPAPKEKKEETSAQDINKEAKYSILHQGDTDETTIIEVDNINVDSFKSILSESGFEGNLDSVVKYANWEYYFELLKNCPKSKDAIKQVQEMDVHFQMGDAEQGGERAAEQARDRVIMDAARNSNRHDIPGNLRAELDMLAKKYGEKPLPWHVILRRAIQAAKRTIVESNVNTRNRYYGTNYQIIPGYINRPIKSVAVIWDVSGSCFDDETQGKFITECNGLIKSGCDVRAYYCDAAVEHVQDCKDRMMSPSEFKIKGGGGTNLSVAISQAIQDGYHIIIQLTDCLMEYPLTAKDLKGRKVITVSTTDSTPPAHYGPCIKVKV